RGLAPAACLVTEGLSHDAEATSVPGPLLGATVQLGTRFLTQASDVSASASVVSLTEGVLKAMFWTKMKGGGVVGLIVATLAAGTGGALAYQENSERPIVQAQAAPQESDKPVVRPPNATRQPRSSAAFVALPPRDELNQLLRRASSEAVALARAKPNPS